MRIAMKKMAAALLCATSLLFSHAALAEFDATDLSEIMAGQIAKQTLKSSETVDNEISVKG